MLSIHARKVIFRSIGGLVSCENLDRFSPLSTHFKAQGLLAFVGQSIRLSHCPGLVFRTFHLALLHFCISLQATCL